MAVFGCGAIGSNVACRLAEAGTGMLRLVDADIMRPGNIVRHAASYPRRALEGAGHCP